MSFLKNAYISVFDVFDVDTVSPFPYLDTVRKVTYGAVYNEDGELEAFSERDGGIGGDRVCSVNGKFIVGKRVCKEKIGGRSVFLGPLHHHYGHFITEGISRLWFTQFCGDFDNYIFTPFLGRGADLNHFHKYFFNALGIDCSRVRIVSEGAFVESLCVPEQLWRVNSSCNDFMSKIYSRISSKSSGGAEGVRYFLTRKQSEFSRIGNVEEVNSLFSDRGFVIVYPEDISLDHQLEIYSGNALISGFPGTALHNVLFSKVGKKVLEVGDIRNPKSFHRMQAECNRISGANVERVSFFGRGNIIDIGYLSRRLDEVRDFWGKGL